MSTTLAYVTTNQGKVRSLRDDLAPYKITIEQIALELPEPRSLF